MAGFHIAEKLGIPYLTSFTMPWTRTSHFPHPFAVPDIPTGLGYNTMTWALMDGVYWKGIQSIVNRFRKQTLGLAPISGTFHEDHQVPILYNFSPSVVSHPPDWKDYVHICGNFAIHISTIIHL
jgi:sterol 3beta-glucosyltransferase